ncbi:MAG: DedA family protein [Chloroflexi bacterium]|nr:DedA family protein [Chloroflexota bacterium]
MTSDAVMRASTSGLTTQVPDGIVPLPDGRWEQWFHPVLHALGNHSYLLVFFGSFLENTVVLGFLLPGGVAVALASAAGREVDASLPFLVALGAAGMCCGAVFDYWLGRIGAERVLLRPWVGRLGPYLLGKLDEAKPHIHKHGWWMMLVVHAFGHGRSSLALAAGASRLSLVRFLLMEAPAALLWSGAFVGGGYFLGGEWRRVTWVMNRMGWMGAAFAAFACLVWWYRRRNSAGSDGGASLEEVVDSSPIKAVPIADAVTVDRMKLGRTTI